MTLLIRLLLAAASPVGGHPSVTRARCQHTKGLRLHPRGCRLEPLRSQSTLQQFANGGRSARHPAIEPKVVDGPQFLLYGQSLPWQLFAQISPLLILR